MPRRRKLTPAQQLDKSLAIAAQMGEALRRIDLDETRPEVREVIEEAIAAQNAVEAHLGESRRLLS